MTVHLIDDPQRTAADPAISAFVTANAGSGKTKTLIDRVARLLLAGVDPEKVLCVTYTKAAAAEMQRRLFGRLGDWSVMADEPLTKRLTELEGARDFDSRRLSEARARGRSRPDSSSLSSFSRRSASSITAQAPSSRNSRRCISAAAALV